MGGGRCGTGSTGGYLKRKPVEIVEPLLALPSLLVEPVSDALKSMIEEDLRRWCRFSSPMAIMARISPQVSDAPRLRLRCYPDATHG